MNTPWTTSDELRFIRTLATADLRRINRMRRAFGLGSLGRDGLLALYAQTLETRTAWDYIARSPCLQEVRRLRAHLALRDIEAA